MTRYYDVNQVLNTGGVDAAGCPYTGTRNDESTPWTELPDRVPSAMLSPGGDSDGPAVHKFVAARPLRPPAAGMGTLPGQAVRWSHHALPARAAHR